MVCWQEHDYESLLLAPGCSFCLLHFAGDRSSPRAPSTSPIPVQIHGQVRYATGGEPAELIRVRLESFRGGVEGEVTTDRSLA